MKRAFGQTANGIAPVWTQVLLAATIVCVSNVNRSLPSLAQDSAKAVILSINDVYRIKGINSGRDGGMPRVRALRAELERSAPDLLFLHAGDFLAPAFLGRIYKGAQMIDLMNVMDGSAVVGSHDPRMFVAFGNHEFDDSHCSKKGPLAARVSESEFTWLASNLDFGKCDSLKPLAGNRNIAEARIVDTGGLKIGLYGLTLPRSKYAAIVSDPEKTSCAQVSALRARGVDAVVALTHLPWQTDMKLLGLNAHGDPLPAGERACAEAPDIVVGGHDHRSMALPVDGPRLFKADADALTAWVIELSKDGEGGIRVRSRLEALDQHRRPDPLAERLADLWLARHDERYCALDCLGKPKDVLEQCLDMVDDGRCLKEEIARTETLIETEEIANRSLETGFGDWLADRVRQAGGADVGFINAGAVRLNYNLEKGTIVRRRHLEQMFPFKNKLVVRQVPGGALWKAMERAVEARGEGAWAHFSGMAVRLRGEEGRQIVDSILVRRAGGGVIEIGPETTHLVRLASLSFVLANGDGHGFKLCPDGMDKWACKDALEAAPNWPDRGSGEDLAEFVRSKLRAAGKGQGLGFATDGRLCDPGETGCLIDRWRAEK